MKQKLIKYVRDKLDAQFDPERDQLIQYLDSVSLLQLVLFVEQEFRVSMDIAELDLAVFTTVDTLAEALEAKRGQ